MAVPYTFGSATTSIPLSQLDSNFATTITLGNTAIQLGNTVTTLNNMTLANVTVSSGSVTITDVTASGNVTATGEIKDQTATRVQFGTVAYSCSSGPSGGFYYNRYTVTFPFAFKSGTLPSVTFSNLQPGFYPTTAANSYFFVESTQTQSNTQFTVTAVSPLVSQSGTIQWTAIGTAP